MATIELRQQDEYLEGITWGQTIFMQLAKRTWMRPNITVNVAPLNGAGRIMITKVTKGELKPSMPLCKDDGEANKATGSLVEAKLDLRVMGEFNGCFTVTDIVPENWRRAIDNATIMQMAMVFQNDVEKALSTGATVSKIDRGELPPAKYLLKLKSEFFTNTGRKPAVALVSSGFYDELIDQHTNLAISGSDIAFIEGYSGRVSGLEIIETDMTEDVILITSDAINIPVMSSSKDIPSVQGLNDTIDLSIFNQGVSGGVVSKVDVNPKGLSSYTYVHFPYGITLINELALKSKPSAPTP